MKLSLLAPLVYVAATGNDQAMSPQKRVEVPRRLRETTYSTELTDSFDDRTDDLTHLAGTFDSSMSLWEDPSTEASTMRTTEDLSMVTTEDSSETSTDASYDGLPKTIYDYRDFAFGHPCRSYFRDMLRQYYNYRHPHRRLGNAKAIPVVGEVVTIAESAGKAIAAGACEIAGEKENAKKLIQGAGKSWEDYAEVNAIAANVNMAIAAAEGDEEKVNRLKKKQEDAWLDIVETTPVVGHAVGAGYYIAGEKEKGDNAMVKATRGAVMLAAGAATGGAGFAPAAGVVVTTGVAYDTIHGGIVSIKEGKKVYKGNIEGVARAAESGDPNDIFDAGANVVGELMPAPYDMAHKSGKAIARNVARRARMRQGAPDGPNGNRMSVGTDGSYHTPRMSMESDGSFHTARQSIDTDGAYHTPRMSEESHGSYHTARDSINYDGAGDGGRGVGRLEPGNPDEYAMYPGHGEVSRTSKAVYGAAAMGGVATAADLGGSHASSAEAEDRRKGHLAAINQAFESGDPDDIFDAAAGIFTKDDGGGKGEAEFCNVMQGIASKMPGILGQQGMKTLRHGPSAASIVTSTSSNLQNIDKSPFIVAWHESDKVKVLGCPDRETADLSFKLINHHYAKVIYDTTVRQTQCRYGMDAFVHECVESLDDLLAKAAEQDRDFGSYDDDDETTVYDDDDDTTTIHDDVSTTTDEESDDFDSAPTDAGREGDRDDDSDDEHVPSSRRGDTYSDDDSDDGHVQSSRRGGTDSDDDSDDGHVQSSRRSGAVSDDDSDNGHVQSSRRSGTNRDDDSDDWNRRSGGRGYTESDSDDDSARGGFSNRASSNRGGQRRGFSFSRQVLSSRGSLLPRSAPSIRSNYEQDGYILPFSRPGFRSRTRFRGSFNNNSPPSSDSESD